MSHDERALFHTLVLVGIVGALLYERHHHSIRAWLVRCGLAAAPVAAPPPATGYPASGTLGRTYGYGRPA